MQVAAKLLLSSMLGALVLLAAMLLVLRSLYDHPRSLGRVLGFVDISGVSPIVAF